MGYRREFKKSYRSGEALHLEAVNDIDTVIDWALVAD